MKSRFEETGEVRSVDLLAGLVGFWRGKTTGALRFSRAGTSAGFDLVDGEIVAASSSEPRFETAAILVRAGKLESGSLERLSLPPGGDAALAALGAGILTRREWKWGEKIRAIEILSDLLAWPDGRYAFDATARPTAGEFALTVPRLLLELFLRSRDRNLIEHQLGPADVPLERAGDFDEEFATFGLTADAESVVRLIDGRATAAEIAERAPAEEFAVLKLLAALATLGLIRTAAAPVEFEERPEVELEEVPLPARELEAEPESPPEEISQEQEAPAAGDVDFDAAATARQLEAWNERSAEERAPAVERIESKPERVVEPEPWIEAAPATDLLGARLSHESRSAESADRGERIPEWSATPDPPAYLRAPGPPVLSEPTGRGGRGWLAAAALLLVGAAIAAVLIIRSRNAPTGSAAVATPTPAFVPSAAPATPAPTTVPRSKAAPAPKAAEQEGGRSEWTRRAERDRARLAADRRTRYAVQVELVCEVPSLVEAWKHDRPAGSLWLLPANHRGRNCYRVLWGRYPSLEAARAAKAGVPGFFTTPANRPAVVSVR